MRHDRLGSALAGAILAGLLLPRLAHAHCDTMDGPVIQAAKAALEKQDLAPALKFVKPEGEAEVKAVFARTLAVRGQSAEARELADRYFFENLVRVHRAGEGAPYTGFKPAGSEQEPAVREADKALESGSIHPLIKAAQQELAEGIRERFLKARETKAHAEHNLEAGRAFVAAYVDYVHYVEALHAVVTAKPGSNEDGGSAPSAAARAH